MTNRFSDMASRVSAERPAHDAAETKRYEAARAAEDARTDSEIAALEQHVRPILKEAEAAFANAGMAFVISENFDVRHRAAHVAPTLSFHGRSAPRQGDNYCHPARPVYFVSDGGQLTVRTERDGGLNLGSAPVSSAGALLETGIEWALKAYHEDMQDISWKLSR